MAAPSGTGRWFLSFDCATKTLAFSLCYVDLPRIREGLPGFCRRLAALRELAARGELDCPRGRGALAALDADLSALFRIAAGDTVDLFPGVADKDIPTVVRIRELARYVDRRIRPLLAGARPLRVLVEFQMGVNAPARAVAAALVALFADEDSALVGPALKNQVSFSPAGGYGAFAARYRKAYDANKAHAAFNFGTLEAAFGSGVDPGLPARLRGHVADSVMQVWGHLLPGEERCDCF